MKMDYFSDIECVYLQNCTQLLLYYFPISTVAASSRDDSFHENLLDRHTFEGQY